MSVKGSALTILFLLALPTLAWGERAWVLWMSRLANPPWSTLAAFPDRGACLMAAKDVATRAAELLQRTREKGDVILTPLFDGGYSVEVPLRRDYDRYTCFPDTVRPQ